MTSPVFSIIIPTLNEEKFLPHLLSSLVSQTFGQFEVIIVNGPSTDKTVEVAKTYEKTLSKLTIITNKKSGVSMQRNVGATLARGQWLVFLDADTVLKPYALERFGWFIKEYNPKLFTTWFSPDSEEGSDAVFSLLGNLYVEGALYLKRDLAPGPLTVVKPDIFASVGGYDEKARWGEDYDLTQRLLKAGTHLQILRETLYVHSLRRMRNEGKIKLLNTYVTGALLALITKKTFRYVPGYNQGGHLYSKHVTTSRLNRAVKQVNDIVSKLFE